MNLKKKLVLAAQFFMLVLLYVNSTNSKRNPTEFSVKNLAKEIPFEYS